MAVYNYSAIIDKGDTPGGLARGVMVADSPRQARDLLRARGLRVQNLCVQTSTTTRRFGWSGSGSGAQSMMAIRDFSTLLSVGMPVVESLKTVAKQHVGSLNRALLILSDRVAAGASVAEAASEQRWLFDELSIRMIEVGENAGNLDEVLRQLADFKERSHRLKDRVVGALLYPAIVLLASLSVTIFMMTVVVPMLLSALIESGRPLPWPTRILQLISGTLVRHGPLVGIVAAVAAFALWRFIKTSVGRRWWHLMMLRAPVLGQMVQKQSVSRLSMVLATLMRSGIAFVRAIEIAARAAPNTVVRDALESTRDSIVAGQDIGRALEKTGIFPPVVIQIFAVGQETGHLADMLDRLATDYDRQVESLSGRLAAILEPTLILGLAIFVGFILFATLLPILEAGNVL